SEHRPRNRPIPHMAWVDERNSAALRLHSEVRPGPEVDDPAGGNGDTEIHQRGRQRHQPLGCVRIVSQDWEVEELLGIVGTYYGRIRQVALGHLSAVAIARGKNDRVVLTAALEGEDDIFLEHVGVSEYRRARLENMDA